jgi:hypothetical protein
MWVAEIVFVEINQVQPQPVLHLTLAKIVQVRLPVPVLGQILRYMPGQKNMPGIAAIHDALRHVDPWSRNVRLVINIGDLIHWAAVHSHPQPNMRMLLQCSADLERTSHRLFRTVEEKERHPVSGRHPDQFTFCFGGPKTFGVSHDLVEFLQKLNLLIDQQFRVTDHVY